MDIVTLAAAKKTSGSGSSVEISTSIDTDKDSNTKAASPKAVNDFVEGKGYLTQHQSLADYAKTADVNAALAAKADGAAVSAAMALKANTADVAAQIAAAIGSVSSFEYYLCGEGEYDAQTGEPTVQDPDTEHIYLVPTSGSNLNMYAYIDGVFTFLGTTEVDLSSYATTVAVNTALAAKADKTELPTVPTNVSAFTNDAGYMTNPRTVYISVTPDSETDLGSGVVGGADHVYSYMREATSEEVAALQNIAQMTGTLYLVRDDLVLTVVLEDDGVTAFANVKPTTTGAQSGMDVDDVTKPAYVISCRESEGYSFLNIAGTESINGKAIEIFSEVVYLTEHQSLAEYTKTSGFHQVAFSGNYNHLNNKPTIPTVPTISTDINADAGSNAKTASPKAVKTFVEGKGYLTQHQSLANVNAKKINGYSVVVQSAPPAAGTSSSQITIVVPE